MKTVNYLFGTFYKRFQLLKRPFIIQVFQYLEITDLSRR